MKPEVHAELSMRKYKGRISDYVPLHQMMDSSKSAYCNNLHRVVFHHIFGTFVMEKMFGIDYDALEDLRQKYNLPEDFIKDATEWKDKCTERGTVRINSDGKKWSPRSVAEDHNFQDFRNKFIPTLQDYIEDCNMSTNSSWVNNAIGVPSRLRKKEDMKEEKAID